MNDVKKYTTVRLTASGIVCKEPLYIFSICGVAKAAASNEFVIYDGHGDNDKKIMSLVTLAWTSDFRPFLIPLFLTKGCYVKFATNGYEIFVQFAEVSNCE